MYGKVMSISDEMMWRYYELLTDVRVEQIAAMKADAASGKAHPMALKKELARGIVADFHSAEAAAKAAEDWAGQFQRDELPQDAQRVAVEVSKVRAADVMPDSGQGGAPPNINSDPSDPIRLFIRTDKLVKEAGLASSVAEASRKIREKAVSINGQLIQNYVIVVSPNGTLTVRVGRGIKLVSLTLL